MPPIADDRRRPVPGGDEDRAAPLDEARFAELYAQWRAPLVSLCRRYLGPTRDAEAMAQDAFIRAWQSRGRFAEGRPFWPWLSTIARRLCTNELLRGRRRAELAHMAASREAPSDGVEEIEMEGVLSGEGVRRVLRTLPTRQQRMLVLRDMEGWSYEEIARFEGVSSEAVRGSLRRARSAFRRVYESIGGSALGGWVTRRRDGVHLWSRLPPFTCRASVDALALGLASLLFVPSGAAVPPARPTVAEVAASPPTSVDTPARRGNAPLHHPPSPTTTLARSDPAPTSVEGDGAPATGEDPGAIYLRQITISPSYEQDRTVFASGDLTGCHYTASLCQALYKSEDGGVHWQRLPAVGLELPLIALPPAYPRDNRIFASSPTTLKVSEDGGRTFRALAAVGGAPRISPLFSNGDPRIFVITTLDFTRLVSEYDDRSGNVKPLPFLLPDASFPVALTFGPTYSVDRHMVIAATRADLTGKVFSCTDLGCRDVLTLERANTAGPPYVVSGNSADTVFAGSAGALYRSDDGGRSFSAIRVPGHVGSRPVVGPDGTVFVKVNHGIHRAELFASHDDGDSWTFLASTDTPPQFSNLVVLPDGRMLAGLTLGGHFGLRCSVDGGRTWRDGCGRPAAAAS